MPPSSNRGTVIAIVAIVVALLAGIGTVGYVVQHQRDEDRAADQRELRERREEADADRRAADVATTTTPGSAESPVDEPVAVEDRRPVDAGGGLSWSMRAEPKVSPTTMTDADGRPADATLWIAELDGGHEGDVATVVDLDGRTFDATVGLDGVVTSLNGRAVGDKEPVEVAGHRGLMLVVTFEQGGLQGVARYAAARFDDRVLVLGTVREGSDVEAGAQAFADLVASVRYE